MKPIITVSESGDSSFVREAIGALENAKVYVGIPEAETSRKGDVITNAALMFIHTNGSELMHIPKRPVIEPAIEANSEQLTRILGQAADAALDQNRAQMQHFLAIAGQQGSNAAKRWFTDPRNGWPRNKSRTIARKLAKLRKYGPGVHADAMQVLVAAGESGDVSNIDTPLIDTGEMRRSITFVTES